MIVFTNNLNELIINLLSKKQKTIIFNWSELESISKNVKKINENKKIPLSTVWNVIRRLNNLGVFKDSKLTSLGLFLKKILKGGNK